MAELLNRELVLEFIRAGEEALDALAEYDDQHLVCVQCLTVFQPEFVGRCHCDDNLEDDQPL